MSRAARPSSITCPCGATVEVERRGPVPSRCKPCARELHLHQMVTWRSGRGSSQGPRRLDEQLLIEAPEELEDGRKLLGCAFEHFRARVVALARDLGLPPPALHLRHTAGPRLAGSPQ